MKPSRLVWGLSVALVVLGLGCSDPYKQTIEPAGSRDYDAFVVAVKKLPLDEKKLVNAYVARMEEDGIRPVGVTLREAIDEQRRHEAEQAALPAKLIDGAVKIARAISPKNQPAPLPTVPPPPVPTTAPPALTAPLATAPTQPSTPPPPTALPTVPPPAATAAPAPFTPITGLELASLLQRVDAEPFPDRRAAIIKEAAPSHYFTTRQAVALAQTVRFPSMQVEILSALYLHIVDPQNFDEAYRLFAFENDRQALKSRVEALR